MHQAPFEQWRRQAVCELHDVLGGGIAIIYVQAASALELMDDQPDQAAAALTTIKTVSQNVITEVRDVLDRLSPPGGGPDRIRALVEDMRRSGLVIDLRMSGERTVPPAVSLPVYRIVQESLTNVLRHVGPTTAVVTLAYERSEIVIEVVNEPAGPGPEALRSGGRGISGMTQRALTLGGTLHAGPLPGGGFRVRARLPVSPDEDHGCCEAGQGCGGLHLGKAPAQ